VKLSQHDLLLKQLKPLIVSPQWEVLVEYLDLLINQNLSALVGATSWEQTKETQGKVKAFKSVKALPDTIRALEHELKKLH
jgi:hypothetical protein